MPRGDGTWEMEEEENGEEGRRGNFLESWFTTLRRVSCVDCCAGGAYHSHLLSTTNQWQASSLTQSTKLWCSNQLISLIALSSKGIHTRPAIHAYLTTSHHLTSPHITSPHLTSPHLTSHHYCDLLSTSLSY